MNGKLFVIDGIDGTGKNTQATLLYNDLKEKYPDTEVAMVSFPRYGTPGCTMVEKYLAGEFGDNALAMDPYTASMLYTIDRSISFQCDHWGEVYRNGGIVVADRYYTSSMIHQGAKILMNASKKPNNPRGITEGRIDALTKWIVSTESEKIRLPKPDKIFWLITDKDSNEKMLMDRVESDKEHISDIHEVDKDYLDYCRETLLLYKAGYTTDLQNVINQSDNIIAFPTQEFVNVNDGVNIRSKEDINDSIRGSVYGILAHKYGMYPKFHDNE